MGSTPIGGDFKEASYTPDKSEIDILIGDENDQYKVPAKADQVPDPLQDKKPPTPEIKKSGDEDEEKLDDEVDDEVDDETKDEEKDETKDEVDDESLEDPEDQVTFRNLNAKYPGIFKQFPNLREILGKETGLRTIFTNKEEAIAAAEKAELFDHVNEKVIGGDAKVFIDTLRENDEGGFKKFTTNFFKTLKEEHKDTYLNLSVPMMKEVILNGLRDAHKNQNNDLAVSVRNFARFAFGSDWKDILRAPDEAKEAPPDPRVTELQQEVEEFRNMRMTEFDKDVTQVCDSEFRKKSEPIFKKLDTENKLTKRQKLTLLGEARREISQKLVKSPDYMRNLKTLRAKAEKAGYSKDWVPSISSAWLGRVTNLLPTILPRLIADELRIDLPNGDQPEKKGSSKPRVPQNSSAPKTRHKPVSPKDVMKTGNAIKDAEDFLAAD